MPNTLPDTSHEAFRALTPEKLAKDYNQITNALLVLKEATYEEIALFLQWPDMGKCSRRLKEMESAQIIYKPGLKKLTKRLRNAYVYKLVQNGEKSAEPEKVMQGDSVSDISRKLIQKSLF